MNICGKLISKIYNLNIRKKIFTRVNINYVISKCVEISQYLDEAVQHINEPRSNNISGICNRNSLTNIDSSYEDQLREIFKNGSRTYYKSSRYFPKYAREDVSILYAFVRTADNLVDSNPQDKNGFYQMRSAYERSVSGSSSGNFVVDTFTDLMRRKNIENNIVEAFLDSMEMDLTISRYDSIQDLSKYIYGSAEVVGIMMANILHLPKESIKFARYLGRAMQLLNFIRDVEEDNSLGRQYLPYSEMEQFGVRSLHKEDATVFKGAFADFMRYQLDRFFEWDLEARKGFRYIPRKFLAPIKTAEDMYLWTGKVIYSDPMIVFWRKVKPSKIRLTMASLVNLFGIYLWKY